MNIAARVLIALGLSAAILAGIHYGTPGPVARPRETDDKRATYAPSTSSLPAQPTEPSTPAYLAAVAECHRLWPGAPSHGLVVCLDQAKGAAVEASMIKDWQVNNAYAAAMKGCESFLPAQASGKPLPREYVACVDDAYAKATSQH